MIRLLTIVILSLTLTACGSRAQINYGADLAVYSGSPQWMWDHLPPGVDRQVAVLKGYYSTEDGSITISEQLDRWETARVFAHELAHAYEHQRPADMWELLLRYQSDRFDFNLHPEQRDQMRAMDAARKAAAEAKP